MKARAIHVVVLAAGRGSRLGTLGEDVPKWLLEVGPRTLADRQLEGIAAAAEHVASVRVVTGHGAQAIERFLAARGGRLDVQTLFNAEFAELNNWWSVLLALRDVPADGAPVAIINADLLAAPSWVGSFLAAAATSAADGLLAVDLERRLTDESMKVELRPDGTLSRIGKVGIEPGEGEYVGMLAAGGDVRDAFRDALEAFVGRPDATNEWYEGAVGRTAAAGVPWHVWPMPGGAWVEIDDDADLEAASALVRS
jgi:choline kinase